MYTFPLINAPRTQLVAHRTRLRSSYLPGRVNLNDSLSRVLVSPLTPNILPYNSRPRNATPNPPTVVLPLLDSPHWIDPRKCPTPLLGITRYLEGVPLYTTRSAQIILPPEAQQSTSLALLPPTILLPRHVEVETIDPFPSCLITPTAQRKTVTLGPSSLVYLVQTLGNTVPNPRKSSTVGMFLVQERFVYSSSYGTCFLGEERSSWYE